MFLTSVTDVGIRKKTNQDSCLCVQGTFKGSEFAVACICDGMGGLAKGEVASAALVGAVGKWCERGLPEFLESGKNSVFDRSVGQMLCDTSIRIKNYSAGIGACGTTIAMLVLYKHTFHIVNVGDSRVYMFTKSLHQLTKDHTYVQREVDRGNLTPEEAEHHPRRSVLLQCVGAGNTLAPDYLHGRYHERTVFLVCCDGFRHVLTPREMEDCFLPANIVDEQKAARDLQSCVSLVKARGEKDNISAILAVG